MINLAIFVCSYNCMRLEMEYGLPLYFIHMEMKYTFESSKFNGFTFFQHGAKNATGLWRKRRTFFKFSAQRSQ